MLSVQSSSSDVVFVTLCQPSPIPTTINQQLTTHSPLQRSLIHILNHFPLPTDPSPLAAMSSSQQPSSLWGTDSNAAHSAVDHTHHSAIHISPPLPSQNTKPPMPRWRHLSEQAIFIAIALGSVAVALFSYRYLIPQARATLSSALLDNFFARPFLYVHAGFAATALLLGPFQFIQSLRRTHLRLHRIMGRVYVLCCLLGGAAALPLSLGSTSGPIAQSGFFIQAVLWLCVTSNGWRLAVQGRIAEHKLWMIRSFGLTFAAVTLRAIIFGFPAIFGMTFQTAFLIASWACWLFNIAVVEAWIWYSSRKTIAVVDANGVPMAVSELALTSSVDKAVSTTTDNEQFAR